MKILFVMRHAGYMRNYEGVLRQLTAEGHRIHVAVELNRERMGADRLGRALSEEMPALTWDTLPFPEDSLWTRAARISRLVVDYARYVDPHYQHAPALRARVRRTVPQRCRPFLTLLDWCGWRVASAVSVILCALERVIPLSNDVTAYVRAEAPDVLLVTPLVEPASIQVDYVKAARALGIPSALCVASWDNLTNKGAIRVAPDRVLVWNQAQADEAVVLHRVPRESVVVTGAQIFDHWFDWRPSRSREGFCARFGFDPERPIVLYLGSSFFIAPHEAEFGVRWVSALRAARDEAVAGANILVRPHPKNATQWDELNLEAWPRMAVWPPAGADFLAPAFKQDYYDSLYYSDAVVGVNTSAQIEAAIVGRIVCTVASSDFAHSQAGTLHFQHLVNGGLLEIARDLDEHVAHLGAALRGGLAQAERSRAFVESFVRPFGLDQAATPRVASAIVGLAALPVRRSSPEALAARMARRLLRPLAWLAVGMPDRRHWRMDVGRSFAWLAVQLGAWSPRVRHAVRPIPRLLRQCQRAVEKRGRRLVVHPWKEGVKRVRRQRRYLVHRLRVSTRLIGARALRMLTR